MNRDPAQPVAVCIKRFGEVDERHPIRLHIAIRPFDVEEEKTFPTILDSYRVLDDGSNWPAFRDDISERFPSIEAIYLNDTLAGLYSWFMGDADMMIPLDGLVRGLLHLDEG